MFVVYSIYNKDNNKIYVGQTTDIENRLNEHNSRLFKGAFTSRYSGNWTLIYKEEYPDRSSALKREKQLKSFRGREFLRKYIPR